MKLSTSILIYPHRWAGALLILILIIPAVLCGLAGRDLILAQRGAAQQAVHTEGEQTREWLRVNLLPVVDTAVTHTTSSLDTFLANLHGDVLAVVGPKGQITGLRGDVMDIATMLGGQTEEIVTIATNLRDSLSPTIANINTASEELPGAMRDGRFLLARSARTVGHVEQAADRFNASLPQYLSIAAATGLSIQDAASESARTATQTRLFMSHLAEATKPLPTWARIGLAVAPPIVQTGFTVGSWMAVRGRVQ